MAATLLAQDLITWLRCCGLLFLPCLAALLGRLGGTPPCVAVVRGRLRRGAVANFLFQTVRTYVLVGG